MGRRGGVTVANKLRPLGRERRHITVHKMVTDASSKNKKTIFFLEIEANGSWMFRNQSQ